MSIIALIGGTGFYSAPFLENPTEKDVLTHWGKVRLVEGHCAGHNVFFLTRHGVGHAVPPHQINYLANIAAMKKVGAKAIFATAAVGSLTTAMEPGSLVVLDQFLDFTKNRASTFFQGSGFPVVHTDMSYPYCPFLRRALYQRGLELAMPMRPAGTYACTEGPRFETAGEIAMFSKLGAHVVGMTGVPEVVLAREAGICYASVSLVTNYAAGISPTALSHEEVVEAMKSSGQRFIELFLATLKSLPDSWPCDCQKRPEANLILDA